MGFLDNLLKGVRDFSTTVRETREAIETAKRQREDLETALPARSDIKELMGRWIDSCSDTYTENLQRHLTGLLRKARQCTDLNSQIARNLLHVLSIQPGVQVPADASSMDVALMAFFGNDFKAAIFRVIDTMEWPGPEGMPWTERAMAIEKLDKRIADLETKYAEMVVVARQSGVIVE
jgi:hypothetical protein